MRHHLWMRRAPFFAFYQNVLFHSVENHRFSLGVCITPQRPPASCWWPEWSLSSNRWGTFHIIVVYILNLLYLSVVGLSLASIQRKLLTIYSKCFSDADKYETTMATVFLLNAGYVMKAKDKDHWQKLFSHFCNRAANEEEEIAHKLLGEQFKVSLSSGHICLIYERVSVSTAPWKYLGIVIPSGWSCCSHRAADVIIFFIQGQLALLHNLFKAALYDDDLSRVRDKSCIIYV